MHKLYADRTAAGEVLARQLARYADRPGVLVLGLPRGGVMVAAPVAQRLRAQLDIVLVRKLSVPDRPELAMGAIAQVGRELQVFRHESVRRRAQVSDDVFAAEVARQIAELRRRQQIWGSAPGSVDAAGRTVIVVDDGLATGSTVRAAVAGVQARGPAEVVVAVPVAAPDVAADLAREVDRLVCPWTPADFHAVGQVYADFTQVADEDVRRVLGR